MQTPFWMNELAPAQELTHSLALSNSCSVHSETQSYTLVAFARHFGHWAELLASHMLAFL